MEDTTILSQINNLVDEEHKLRQQLAEGEISAAEEHDRLRAVEESLDQCWDLLRRRRAAREFGQDADAQQAHSKQEVENYLQ
ncbi:hypothetical protein J2S43_000677 [Catenuloplanes nepalensis]|uniref:DUF2630 domain-containing protein n=1 Tax=Catenuloplanes nepalensis TaxID=587533 RepID=A0ABT9ML59_9ACTN|nr:DUF2630 family protein [Catenuloplanes nepalensis]MDP9792165.1 hypothetical protein [Catenuloplanes nepalensis]